jgi:hypothetical protein
MGDRDSNKTGRHKQMKKEEKSNKLYSDPKSYWNSFQIKKALFQTV